MQLHVFHLMRGVGMMSDTLIRDAATLRTALASAGTDEVEVLLALPRDAAELVLQLLEAPERGGAVVLPAGRDLTTTEAAKVLGVSRPHLTELLKIGAIEHRMVGSHRRVPAAALLAFKQERDRRHAALDDLMALSDELGFVE
ncbi:MAG: helix-turn-helix domain-containing protein [Nigerium sp.]|nr:helix-turn-helix domain-containing protein [Nigerium sp.]